MVKPESITDGFEEPEQSVPRATNQNNYQEWLDAIQGKVDHGQSYFQLAGPMTETILLGVLAQRVPDTELHWNAQKMEVKGRPELKKFIQRAYLDGWQWKI